ncbi:MAG: AzlC family ABC transporter permease [Kiritimatiellae bacterium]|nr:AzlC family ABC transporter permease [Kiritimatiellia bacterium]
MRDKVDRNMVFRKAFSDSVPVMAGYGTMGFAAGVLLSVHGGVPMPALWAALSSAAFISGPLQYLFVDWVRVSASIGGVLFVVLCVNLRYSLYGLSLLDTFKGAGFWTRAYLIAGITDETYALEVACKLPPEGKLRYCLFLTALDHMYWIIGVTAGSLAGAALPVPSKGIDFAMTSLFLVILTEQCRERANRLPAIIGGVSAIAVFAVLALFLGMDKARAEMLIPTMMLMVTVLLACRRRMEKGTAR